MKVYGIRVAGGAKYVTTAHHPQTALRPHDHLWMLRGFESDEQRCVICGKTR